MYSYVKLKQLNLREWLIYTSFNICCQLLMGLQACTFDIVYCYYDMLVYVQIIYE